MLSSAPVSVTLPFRGLDVARDFYGKKLGLKQTSGSVEKGWLEYEAGKGSMLQLFESDSDRKSDNTAATFEVGDLDEEMTALRKQGVTFVDYDLPHVKTVQGVAQMEGHRMAWIRDPDGNILALFQAE